MTTQSPGQPRPPRATPRAAPPTDQSVKDTLESIVVAFALAFVFRAFVCEAFLIPTGSMAPTLLGQHLRVTDPQTGYRFAVGVDPPTTLLDGDGGFASNRDARSPLTGRDIDVPRGTKARPGDRILVLKYLYGVSPPKRWDVVVFKAPHEPQTNYIKRLIGLPNEAVAMLDGNVYTHPIAPHADAPPIDAPGWQIARKTDRPDTQASVFRTIYDSRYIPDAPIDPHANTAEPDAWPPPWTPVGDTADQWLLQGQREYTYRADTPGSLRFDFERHDYASRHARYPYNQFKRASNREPIEDIRLAVDVRPQAHGTELELRTTARLGGEHRARQPVIARIDATGSARLYTRDPGADADRPLSAAHQTTPLQRDRITRVELWHVDQHTILRINGTRVAEHRDDPTLAQVLAGPSPTHTPDVSISLSAPATLTRVVLDRDLYYAGQPSFQSARGALFRRPAPTGDEPDPDAPPTHIADPAALPFAIGPDRFWVIGDNSPHSDDGRFWNHIDPAVRSRFFDPAEFDNGRSPAGLVPRNLMVGRAFFVYFPAPLAITPDRHGLIPNFADMRFIK
ncbi:MAG: signal peptidase I [Planctomycetota bacterium]